MVSIPTVAKKWKSPFEFKSFYPLVEVLITKERGQISAIGREKREAKAWITHKLCGPPGQNHPKHSFIHSFIEHKVLGNNG